MMGGKESGGTRAPDQVDFERAAGEMDGERCSSARPLGQRMARREGGSACLGLVDYEGLGRQAVGVDPLRRARHALACIPPRTRPSALDTANRTSAAADIALEVGNENVCWLLIAGRFLHPKRFKR